MAYELRSGERQMLLSSPTWVAALTLAKVAGWQQLGTLPPKPRKVGKRWNGKYTVPDGRVVSSDDARGLAVALKSVLPHIPDEDRFESVADKTSRQTGWGPPTQLPGEGRGWVFHVWVITDWHRWFSGTGKVILGDLIALCENGEFEIW